MSKCANCARFLHCPRPEPREDRLEFVKTDLLQLSAYISERLDAGEAVPAGLFVEYIASGSSSPYEMGRRIYAVVFHLNMDGPALAEVVSVLKKLFSKAPTSVYTLIDVAICGAFQLYEWDFYKPHVARFKACAMALGMDSLVPGMEWADAKAKERFACAYLSVASAVDILEKHAPKTMQEASDLLDTIIESSAPPAAAKGMSVEDFMEVQPVGGIN